MTAEEVIKELQKLPKDKIVKIGTITQNYGDVSRVIEYDEYIEIESDNN